MKKEIYDMGELDSVFRDVEREEKGTDGAPSTNKPMSPGERYMKIEANRGKPIEPIPEGVLEAVLEKGEEESDKVMAEKLEENLSKAPEELDKDMEEANRYFDGGNLPKEELDKLKHILENPEEVEGLNLFHEQKIGIPVVDVKLELRRISDSILSLKRTLESFKTVKITFGA